MLPKPQTSSRLLSSATQKRKFSKRELTKKRTIKQIFYVVCAAECVRSVNFNWSNPPGRLPFADTGQACDTTLTRSWHSVMQKEWCHFGHREVSQMDSSCVSRRAWVSSPVLSPPAHAEMWDTQCISQPTNPSLEKTCVLWLTLLYFQAFLFNINIQQLLSLCKDHKTAHNRPRPIQTRGGILSHLVTVHILHRSALVLQLPLSRPFPHVFPASGIHLCTPIFGPTQHLQCLQASSQSPRNRSSQVWMLRRSFSKRVQGVGVETFQKLSHFLSLVALHVSPEEHSSLELFWKIFSSMQSSD